MLQSISYLLEILSECLKLAILKGFGPHFGAKGRPPGVMAVHSAVSLKLVHRRLKRPSYTP